MRFEMTFPSSIVASFTDRSTSVEHTEPKRQTMRRPISTGVTLVVLSLPILAHAQVQSPNPPAKPQTPTVNLLLAKDHLPGSFLTSEAVYSSRDNVYLASYEGKLFVLDSSKPDFPVVAAIQVSTLPLRAVRGDHANIYVTSDDGNLYVYQNKRPFRLVAARAFSSGGLKSVAVDGSPKGSLIMSQGQTEMAADSNRIYLSILNEGDKVLVVDKTRYAVEATFGEPFEPNTTVVYDRYSGERIGGIPNPPDIFGRLGQVALYTNGDIMVQTTPGCCGTGIFLYDAADLQLKASTPLANSNAVTTMNGGKWLVAGTEAGTVAVFDISLPVPAMLASIDLREVTGHTGSEDIEIRSVWADCRSGLVYAASSWGNSFSKTLTLPSFFVLQVE